MESDFQGEIFLDKLYSDLYANYESRIKNKSNCKRYEVIRKYLDRLDKIHKMADTDHKKELLIKMYLRKYVIDEKNIPFGFDIDKIIKEQEKSLRLWLDYFLDYYNDFPIWAKYWAFQGMLKVGAYDEYTNTYTRRNKKTVNPFLPYNREVMDKSIRTIVRLVKEYNLDDVIMDEDERKISKNDSFKTIYCFYEKKYKEKEKNKFVTDGIWKKYKQGSKEDAKELAFSLNNRNTGWCSVKETIATLQLCGPYFDTDTGGDFYVYYTKDENGECVIPRIAIRLIGNNEVAEIRGVASSQSLEEELMKILEDKLFSMTFLSKKNIDKQLEIIKDLKYLSSIQMKTELHNELTEEEIYDLYTKEFGFGVDQDPRVYRIKSRRSILKDYQKLTNEKYKRNILIKNYRDFPLNSITDSEMSLVLVKEDGTNIRFISKDVEKYKELCFMAVRQKSYVIKYFDYTLDFYEELCKIAVSKKGYVIMHVDKRVKNYKELCLIAVRNDPWALESMNISDENYTLYCLEALKYDSNAIEFVDKNYKGYEEIRLFANSLINNPISTNITDKTKNYVLNTNIDTNNKNL